MLTKLKHFVPENIYIVFFLLYLNFTLYIYYGVLILGNTCKIYLDEIFKLQKSGRCQIAAIHVEATPGLCSQNRSLYRPHVKI